MRAAIYGKGGNLEAIRDEVERIPDVQVTICGNEAELAGIAGQCDFLMMQHSFYKDDVEAAIVSSDTVRWVQLLSAGYDGMVGRRLRPDLVVTNAGPSFGAVVADHAMALLLALTRCMPDAALAQAKGQWQRSIRTNAVSLDGGKAVVVGFGPIGQQIARRLRGFGMEVCAINRRGEPHPDADQVLAIGSLDTALASADVVVLALPLNASTQNLFDAARLARIKPGARIVNIGRGGVIDLDALMQALESGHVAGAGLDVTEPEPLPEGHPAFRAPNMVITPHMAGAGAAVALARFIAGNVEAFIAGRPLQAMIDHRDLTG